MNPYTLIEMAKANARQAVAQRALEQAFLALEERKVIALEMIANALNAMVEAEYGDGEMVEQDDDDDDDGDGVAGWTD